MKLMVLAWILALISLPAPAEDTPLILLLYRVPVGLELASSFLAPLQPAFRCLIPVPFSVILFLLSPLAFVGQAGQRRILAQRFASIGLLGVWAFPIIVEFFIAPRDRHLWGFQRVAWGYYLYAIANTLAFVAIQIGPQAAAKADRRHGFPVVPYSGRER